MIGLLDVPDTFLDPDRMRAGLLWFTRGFVEYQFPNNATLSNAKVDGLELAMELSSEVPGTSKNWPSDITIAINGHEIDTWTAPADYGDKRGKHTPDWWKLAGSQYGDLKTLARHEERHLSRRRQGFANARWLIWNSSVTARSGYESA